MECCHALPACQNERSPTTDSRKSLRGFALCSGRGGTRTRTSDKAHGILNPERLPFRHSAKHVTLQ